MGEWIPEFCRRMSLEIYQTCQYSDSIKTGIFRTYISPLIYFYTKFREAVLANFVKKQY
jgi:hypothetical protein